MSPFAFRPARRGQSYVMMGVAGYSGTGKTYSALRLARGLAGDKPFAVIDTEAGRALHYDKVCSPWDHAELEPPFTPEAYLAAIRAAESAGYSVIVVDSMSHEYSGIGGLHDQAEAELERMAGNDARLRVKLTASAWIKPKAAHRRFVEQLLRVKAHLILCFRAREAIEMRKDPRTGKVEIVPVESIPGHPGWLIETEHKNMPLPYELTVSFLLIPRSGDERGLPIPVKLEDQHKPFVPLDKPLSEQTGAALAQWAQGSPGEPTVDPDAVQMADWLTEQILALSSQPEKTRQAIDKHRAANGIPAHVDWLSAQLQRAQNAKVTA